MLSHRCTARFLALSFLFGVLFLASIASAGEEEQLPPPRAFSGSFAEFSLRGGPAFGADAAGWTLDAGFRNSVPFYLTDNRVSYRFLSLPSEPESANIHSLHATFGLHPFYLAILSEGLISHFLASLHLELGAGAQLGLFQQDGDSRTAFGLAGSLGSGFDLPLTDPNRGQGLWINTLYRRTWTTLSTAGEVDSASLHDHAFFVGLAWRKNGGFW